MKMLSDRELSTLSPAEDASAPTPLPVQVVSSDEFMPSPQTERQRKVEARLNALAHQHFEDLVGDGGIFDACL